MNEPCVDNYISIKRKPLFLVSLICIIYALIVVEWNYLEEGNYWGLAVLAVGYILGIIACVTCSLKRWSAVICIVILYLLVITVSIIFSNSQENILEDFIKNTSWCIMFIMAYQWGIYNINFRPVINIITYIVLPLLYVMYLDILSHTFFLGAEYGFRDAIIPIAVLSPFPLFLRNKKVRNAHLIIIIFLCLLSAKRSVILGVVLGVIVFLLKNYRSSNNKIKWIFTLLIITLISYISLSFFEADTGVFNIAFGRFQEMFDGDSSGRDSIATHVLNAYKISDGISQAFGHGSHSTVSFIGKLTHNDFLQVLYDYGFIALIVFVCLYIKLLIVGYKSFNNRHYPVIETSTYCYTIVLFVFLGMFNCFISSPQTFTLIIFVCGYIMGQYKYLNISYRNE